jgi:HAD domain in Swiss Army Knife RNA repair proteins
MKVIFLDHDGVICLAEQWGGRYKKKGFDSNPETPLDIRMDNFDPKAINVLKAILEETGAEIVVSSDWRNWGTLAQMQEMYETRGIKKPIGITPFINDCDVPTLFIWSRDFDLEQTRSLEILQWLKDHPEVTHWVAVDDLDMSLRETPVFTWGLTNFVLTPKSREGIKQSGIKEKILKHLI